MHSVSRFCRRRGQARERQALVDIVSAGRLDAERRAVSEIRTAREAVAATERALKFAQTAAQQANEVVQIIDVAFRERATTNIEVIDAQRRARDAETAAAIAEDAVRREIRIAGRDRSIPAVGTYESTNLRIYGSTD